MIPNAFSPNDDGINDRFRIIEENITVKRFDIYNRWGIKVLKAQMHSLDGMVK
ncbi:MAG: gliding motility-associated C-terminal domain-containing protein [Bacteroidetes bacterium]|nr:gliding motility-associated C-terminal domain-containing protein [Bacteroidota bacterium]